MNKIVGLVVATKREFNTIFKFDDSTKINNVETNPFNVITVEIEDKKIYAILAGVGQSLAAAATQHLIDKYSAEIILNYGVVGALVDGLNINNTVLIDKIIDYDFDTVAIGDEKIGWHKDVYPTQFIEADKGLIASAKTVDPTLQTVICASGNKFISDIKIKESLAKEYGASICEMESAGIALVAHKNKVPAIYIKGVSDSKSGGADEFNKMIYESSSKAYKLLLKIIKEAK